MPIESNADSKEANVKVGMAAGSLHQLRDAILEADRAIPNAFANVAQLFK